MIKKITLLLFIIFYATASIGAAKEFRFTITSDNRNDSDKFHHALKQINKHLKNYGVFHISPGDLDPPEKTFQSLKTYFGEEVTWYPVIGNHDEEKETYMQWFRNYYNHYLKGTVNPGPDVAKETCYSWDYENAHFVVLNVYVTDHSDRGGYGNISDTLLDWLKKDLSETDKPFIFVFGHEPAFPEYRHVGDSLDHFPANRNRFWNFLEARGVTAYICGHTHYYYTHTESGGSTTEINAGITGWDAGDGNTFLDVIITDTLATFNVWKNKNHSDFAMVDTITLNPPPKYYVQNILIAKGTDDAEEKSDGTINLNNHDLTFPKDGHLLGLRFENVFIPPLAEIEKAYIQFSVDEPSATPATFTIFGENTIHSLAFASTQNNISLRKRTEKNILWKSTGWQLTDDQRTIKQTPNISPILQHIINKDNWQSGNAITFIITGEGDRIAESFEGHQKWSPVLHINVRRP